MSFKSMDEQGLGIDAVDALRAGLQLKDQFPHHDIKVRAMPPSELVA
jgi:hypothetical protein